MKRTEIDTFTEHIKKIEIDKMSNSQEPVKDDASGQHFDVQTSTIVQQIFYALLSDEGVVINDSCCGASESNANVVCEAVIRACRHMLELYGKEIRAEIDTLDISPSALCASYHQVANGLFEGGCNWGKLIMLFQSSSLLAARIYLSGQTEHVQSIKEWLLCFILGSLKNWILQHDGWESFPNTFRCYRGQDDVTRETARRPWLHAAALFGISAAVAVGVSFIGSIKDLLYGS